MLLFFYKNMNVLFHQARIISNIKLAYCDFVIMILLYKIKILSLLDEGNQ